MTGWLSDEPVAERPEDEEGLVAGLVAMQMGGVVEDWAQLLGTAAAFEPPIVSHTLAGAPSAMQQWPIVGTVIDVEGDLRGSIFCGVASADAAPIAGMLLGREATSLDEEVLDAVRELFNLFCGATDRAFRRNASQKLHVKQVSTAEVTDPNAMPGWTQEPEAWLARVHMRIGDATDVSLVEVIPRDLGLQLIHLARERLRDVDTLSGSAGAVPRRRQRVLVVDDSSAMRVIIRNYLTHGGYEVQEAESAEEALSLIERSVPSLVLLDVNLPHMNGIEACRQIRKMADARDLPVILCTTRNRREDVVQGIQARASDYVVKPFTREILLRKVARFVQPATKA